MTLTTQMCLNTFNMFIFLDGDRSTSEGKGKRKETDIRIDEQLQRTESSASGSSTKKTRSETKTQYGGSAGLANLLSVEEAAAQYAVELEFHSEEESGGGCIWSTRQVSSGNYPYMTPLWRDLEDSDPFFYQEMKGREKQFRRVSGCNVLFGTNF